ncbi:MAG: hypothetical protein SPI12_03970 [Actinomycetaceae bacterium]|nr:hypothetical protein [Actinomycetaceae bacterium]MDY6083002.1 hypothetical protein [Actinomycetaceae bacterium]
MIEAKPQPSLSVRPLEPDDAPAVALIQRTQWRNSLRRATTLDELEVDEVLPSASPLESAWSSTLLHPAPTASIALLGLVGDKPSGFATAVPAVQADPSAARATPATQGNPHNDSAHESIRNSTHSHSSTHVMEITSFGIQAQGPQSLTLATLIMDALAEESADSGFSELQIWAFAGDDGVTRFLSAQGFAPTGYRRRFQIGAGSATQHLWHVHIETM